MQLPIARQDVIILAGILTSATLFICTDAFHCPPHKQHHRVTCDLSSLSSTYGSSSSNSNSLTNIRPSRLSVLLHSQSSSSSTVPTDVGPLFPQQPPHAGCHFDVSHLDVLAKENLFQRVRRRYLRRGRNRRFMEGWYYRVTLTEEEYQESFAFIFSIEDPHSNSKRQSKSPLTRSCAQIMGPGDSYLVQSERRDTAFWAWRRSQGLGCTFEYYDDDENNDNNSTSAMSPEQFRQRVKTGFQMLPRSLQGRIEGHDGSLGGVDPGQGIPGTCDFDMEIEPVYGWGDERSGQRSAAGWLASYPVFEPHWQITQAHARASGTITWKNKTYTFQDQPFYAEKNWGGSFPIKWYWLQCNAFQNHPDLAVTAGGGIRKLPLSFGKTEQLGLVGVHHNGTFYEAVPWTGTMEWEVDEWGSWSFKGRCCQGSDSDDDSSFEVEVTATTAALGVKLRAPMKEGMIFACRDSFYATVSLSLYRLEYDAETGEYVRDVTPIVDNAVSYQGAVEIGGGPWWDTWKGKSDMKQPMRGLVKLPYRIRAVKDKLKGVLFRGKKNNAQ